MTSQAVEAQHCTAVLKDPGSKPIISLLLQLNFLLNVGERIVFYFGLMDLKNTIIGKYHEKYRTSNFQRTQN